MGYIWILNTYGYWIHMDIGEILTIKNVSLIIHIILYMIF